MDMACDGALHYQIGIQREAKKRKSNTRIEERIVLRLACLSATIQIGMCVCVLGVMAHAKVGDLISSNSCAPAFPAILPPPPRFATQISAKRGENHSQHTHTHKQASSGLRG